MAIDAKRDRDRRVAKPLLHNAWMNALLKRQRRPRVPQAVEGQPREAVALDAADEGVAGGVGTEP